MLAIAFFTFASVKAFVLNTIDLVAISCVTKPGTTELRIVAPNDFILPIALSNIPSGIKVLNPLKEVINGANCADAPIKAVAPCPIDCVIPIKASDTYACTRSIICPAVFILIPACSNAEPCPCIPSSIPLEKAANLSVF